MDLALLPGRRKQLSDWLSKADSQKEEWEEEESQKEMVHADNYSYNEDATAAADDDDDSFA